MKAITIKQPWATLIALGEKQFETRSWKTRHRGKIAIHAGKSIDMDAFHYEEIQTILNKHGIYKKEDLPFGSVIATADLTDCLQVMKDNFDSAETDKDFIDEKEYPLGDFSEGRYAWKLENVEVLDNPIPAKGQLSLWEWNK